MRVPFLDLRAQYQSIKKEIDTALHNAIDNCTFILGPDVKQFEEDFASFCRVKHAIAVNSGTAALHLALLVAGIKEGDEVITVPNSFFATAEAISHCGARPVFVDVEEDSYNLDVELLESKITDKTKAIVPVHLYGNPSNISKVCEIAKKHNLIVIEDACQAHGAEHNGQRVGTFGLATAFSFYPGKNLGAYGEGGMVVTNDDSFAEKCRLFRAHGENPKNTHHVVGYNYRMAGLQGAVLGVKLKHLEKWNEARRQKAMIYDRYLPASVKPPKIASNNVSVFHLYVIRHPERDRLREFLKSRGIDTGIHYLKPIHLQNSYKDLGYMIGDYPVAERLMSEIVSLPIYPELTEEQIKFVCDSIKEFVKQ